MLNREKILGIIAIVAIIGLVFTACDDDGGGDGSPGCDASCLAIGAAGPGGGKIIYHNHAGFNVTGLGTCYYLEAAPSNHDKIKWCNCTDSNLCNVTGATGTAIGTGKANTAAIIAVHKDDTASNNASKAAVAYTGGGKNDWFLPSKDESSEMYKARTHLGISSDWFWTSSQSDDSSAWNQDFDSGYQDEGGSRYSNYNVRVIRAF